MWPHGQFYGQFFPDMGSFLLTEHQPFKATSNRNHRPLAINGQFHGQFFSHMGSFLELWAVFSRQDTNLARLDLTEMACYE